MENLTWHPHYDVWALIVTLVVFFEFTTNKDHIKKPKRKTWYSGLVMLWIFTDYPIHDIGEKYLFSVHSVEHLVLALVSPPLLLMGIHKEMKELISVKPFIKILKITSVFCTKKPTKWTPQLWLMQVRLGKKSCTWL